jgi:hypothetical protein
VYRRVASALASPFVLAAVIVLGRLWVFDAWSYFGFQAVPNHDMYHASTLFCTSMHSARLSGDIAWWNPAEPLGGCAQYFNGFLAPLAPTTGNLVFVVWWQIIALLGRIGIALPEYVQFLVVEFIVLPYLTAWFLVYFLRQFLKRQAAVLLVLIVYTFSGIGLWNSAWFYYQESWTSLFLLGSILAMLRRPTPRHMLVSLIAVLVQAASANYWTVYNSFFLTATVAIYATTHKERVWRLGRRLRQWTRQRPWQAGGAVLAALSTLVIWTILLSAVLREQGPHCVRETAPCGYGPESALGRVQEARKFTLEFFNPVVQRAIKSYGIFNPLHNARYLGAFLLPLIAMFPVFPWHRRERWFAVLWLVVFIICLAPGILLPLWNAAPFNRILHLFYFYTHHLQLCTVLIAACVLDRLLADRRSPAVCAVQRKAASALVAGCLAVMALGFAFSEQFPAGSLRLQSILIATMLILTPSVFLLQLSMAGRARSLTWLGVALNVVAVGDLTRYFYECSKLDQSFTSQHRFTTFREGRPIPSPLPPETRDALARPWRVFLQDSSLSARLFDNMPVENFLWPSNKFNPPLPIAQFRGLPAELQRQFLVTGPALDFYDRRQNHPGREFPGPGASELTFHIDRWTYNEFMFSLTVPRTGWLIVRQLHDRYWRYYLDGQSVEATSANLVSTALPVSAGQHTFRMRYRPWSQRVYPWAAMLLELVTGALGLTAIRAECRR